jgi:CHASE3 domain sensor protein
MKFLRPVAIVSMLCVGFWLNLYIKTITVYWMEHTYKVMIQAELIISTVDKSLLAKRMYCFTLDKRYQQEYYRVHKEIEQLSKVLNTSTHDNVSQTRRIAELDALLITSKTEAAEVMRTAVTDQKHATEIMIAEGIPIKGHIDDIIHSIVDEEERLLNQRKAADDVVSMIIPWIFTMLAIPVVYLLMNTGHTPPITIDRRKPREET